MFEHAEADDKTRSCTLRNAVNVRIQITCHNHVHSYMTEKYSHGLMQSTCVCTSQLSNEKYAA